MSRFGVRIHPEAPVRVEAWGELCISTVPDLQACVLRALEDGSGDTLVVDLQRVWFCDLSGLRATWWLWDLGRSAGTEVVVRESAAIRRVARLVGHVRTASTA
jgi:anti-anti-sigma regulatory factor